MLCPQCRTINPDRCRNCLECQSPLSARLTSISTLPSSSTTKPIKPINQNVIKTTMVSDSISLGPPSYFTAFRKILFFIFGTIPTIIFVVLFTLEMLAFYYMIVPPEILLLTKLVTMTVFITGFYGLFPVFGCDWAVMRHFANFGDGFVAQVSFLPRRYRGWEGFLEDADDIGIVRFENNRLIFLGDSTRIVLAQTDIATIKFEKKGRRTAWLLGPTALFELKYPLAGINSIYINPRMGLTLFQGRRFNRAFCQAVKSTFPNQIIK
jgi:hypothetical protein